MILNTNGKKESMNSNTNIRQNILKVHKKDKEDIITIQC